MSKAPPNYKEKFKDALKFNCRQVLKDLEKADSDLEEKIKTRCAIFGYNLEDVKNKMREEPIISDIFAKDPARQNIYEKTAAKFIESLDIVEDFRNLGTKELSVSNGGVYTKEEMKHSGGQSSAKTIDFSWKCRDRKFYASHKYTKESGGAQESQYKDLKKFIEEANKSTNQKHHFIAIADGDFYQGKDASANKTKMESLKDEANKAKRVFAMPIFELEEFLISLAGK